jgi:hypothetical protein
MMPKIGLQALDMSMGLELSRESMLINVMCGGLVWRYQGHPSPKTSVSFHPDVILVAKGVLTRLIQFPLIG